MREFIDEHFDKLFLGLIFGIVTAVYILRGGDAKGWVDMVLGAAIMLLTGRGKVTNGK